MDRVLAERDAVIERVGDLWRIADEVYAPVVITTNGSVRRDGRAVMGRGCALEAKQRFPGLAADLGRAIVLGGNHVNLFYVGPPDARGEAGASEIIITFPVKHAWNDIADLALIVRSGMELCDVLAAHGIKSVVMPRPGCGNGRLKWPDVKAVLDPILDDRFVVVHPPAVRA